MSKAVSAVIQTGNKQYIVSEGDVLNVELLGDAKKVSFAPLLVIDGDKISVGTPAVGGVSVAAEVLDEVKADKVTAIRYKAKKRVHKLHGHRQRQAQIKITKIA